MGQNPPTAFLTGGPGGGTPTDDQIWKQIQLHSDLYRHYLDITLKFNAFYYVMTGAILSFYLSRSNPGLLRFALLLPITLGVTLAAICVWGGWLNLNTRAYFLDAARQLRLTTWPELRVLTVVLWASGGLFFLVAVALIIVLILGDAIFVTGQR